MRTNHNIDLKQYIIPIYLGVLLLIILPLSLLNGLIVLLPLLLISIGIYANQEQLKLLGFSLLLIASFAQIIITSIEQITLIITFSLLILLPSLVLLSQLLGQTTIQETIQRFLAHPKSLVITGAIALCFLFIVYFISSFVGGGILFSSELIQEQIILITGISFFFFIPFLLKRPRKLLNGNS